MPGSKIGVIGAGNMGSAIIRGVLRAGLFPPDRIAACDVMRQKAEALARELNINILESALQLARAADIVLVAVKPQTMGECLKEIREAITPADLVISIAAGISTGFIEERLPKGTRVIRVMPNTPALVGAGVTAICSGSQATGEDMAQAERIFAGISKVYRLPESMMDAVTAVSGSGPAYLFYFAECLADAARKSGLPPESTAGLVAQTIFGSAKLLMESGEDASILRAKVTSPGGTTEAALAVMKKGGFSELLTAAVTAAVKRGRELGGAKNIETEHNAQ